MNRAMHGRPNGMNSQILRWPRPIVLLAPRRPLDTDPDARPANLTVFRPRPRLLALPGPDPAA